ncbi:conserved hypothetical protein [uncultured Desulfatiglans sp.]|uniref:Transposase n=1 Tax=Uncultured Desulfatiglans sp. TaxID=1748965 RepID=A0A653A6C6_UNCDX|nr:conserved hypothetical protein [uncultured Desulfatiglans sp.]
MKKLTQIAPKRPMAEETGPVGDPVAPGATGSPTGDAAVEPPDPEVIAIKRRRNFTAKYKLRILAEVDGCAESGQVASILRREGLYSSNLTCWRRQREEGMLQALQPKKRGRKQIEQNPLAPRLAQLEKENRKLKDQLRKAETIIEVQKKISEILGIPQDQDKGNGKIS